MKNKGTIQMTDKILEKLPEERAEFDATLAAKRVELESRRVQFLDLLK